MTKEDHPIFEAARYSDAVAEEGRQIDTIIDELGIPMDKLLHLAEQRAQRVVMILNNRTDELERLRGATRENPLSFDMKERTQIASLIPPYLDGIVIGWKGHQISSLP